ncbi:hypothetical protein [Priestia megaterium]|uniref:hypothetical protein n=1 Tax=Priestia megaterium TaxID=1404 RepID=UPI003D2CF918
MYQESYPYGYHYPYNGYMNNFRAFAGKEGTFVTVLADLPVSGGVIPSGSRVFIHKVRMDTSGTDEIVTIVFPQLGMGGSCVAGATDVLGSMLGGTPPVLHLYHGAPPRPPR